MDTPTEEGHGRLEAAPRNVPYGAATKGFEHPPQRSGLDGGSGWGESAGVEGASSGRQKKEGADPEEESPRKRRKKKA